MRPQSTKLLLTAYHKLLTSFKLFCEIVRKTGALYLDEFQIVEKLKGYNISELSDQNSSC